eukprot:5473969-Lingulodinium_polyedra.AAC.1
MERACLGRLAPGRGVLPSARVRPITGAAGSAPGAEHARRGAGSGGPVGAASIFGRVLFARGARGV